MRIDEVRESEPEPARDREADALVRFQALRELCQGLLELPAGEGRDTGGEILAAVAMAEASLDVLAAHIHRLYPDPNEGA